MSTPAEKTHSMETLFVSPNAADTRLTVQLLQDSGIQARGCAELAQLIPQLPEHAGCAVIVEEALDVDALDDLSTVLRHQPQWCDFPFIVIGGQHSKLNPLIERLFPHSGNITLLERPLSPVSLVSAVRVALRARRRQYEVKNLLHERDESLRRRDEFLAMLAHELRNPLAPIRNAAHVMKALPISDPVFNRARELVEKQVVHMSRLVNDLLDVSRLELGKVQLQRQRLQLNAAVESAVEACTASGERNHAIRLRLSAEPLAIDGDLVRIEQIVCNLVNNAIKYTPSGGLITITTELAPPHAVLTVEDTGVGIAAGLEEGIFDLFTQDNRTLARSEGGLGIGLTVVKRLVDLHGGSIEASSQGLNQGARFVVRLPLAGAAAPAHAAQPAGARNGVAQTRRVLVVEDNPDIRETLEMLLTMWGHEVHFAETGPEGVARAGELKPEIALVDIGLPGMSGYDVARAIRQHGWSAATKLVAMTGYGQPSDVRNASAAGFDTHLLKPVDPVTLEHILAG